MNTPQFEWQEPWDGTQPPVGKREGDAIRASFRVLASTVIMNHLATAKLQPNKHVLSLRVPAKPANVNVTIRNIQNGWQWDPSILLSQRPKLGSKLESTEGLRVVGQIASWYFLQSGLVVRQDFDTRPHEDILATNDTLAAPANVHESIQQFAANLTRRAKSFPTDLALGFERQPIHFAEMDALTEYLQAARPVETAPRD